VALHDAGYRAVAERLGDGRLLDVGCGLGFATMGLAGPARTLVGVDYSEAAVRDATRRFGAGGLRAVVAEATRLPVITAAFDWVTSSHLVEHFDEPGRHVAELARVVRPGGTVFVVTPNAPADFENPFHVSLFRRHELADLLAVYFEDVAVLGLDAAPAVKEDFAARRAKAARLLRLDVFDLRHRLPRSWYIAAYERLLPLAYRLVAKSEVGGRSGISAQDFFVTEVVDDTTLVLFAVARRPRRAGADDGSGDRGARCSPSA
jgi:SAM-dependent methyltransferase